jgi:superfamily II DNA or RNA helicase
MGLSSSLAGQVSPAVRKRGQGYYTSGAVRIRRGDDRSVEAAVQGTERYQVTLRRGPKALRVWCTCPYCDEFSEPCKHIWATILTADAWGYLRPPPGENDPRRVILTEDAAEEDGWATPATPRLASTPRALPTYRPQPPRRPPPWEAALTRVRGELERQETQNRDSWPPNRQILYLIDLPGSLTGSGLVLEVAFRQRKRDGSWSKIRSQRIPANQAAHLPNPDDRHLLAMLAGAKEASTSSYWGGYSSYYYADTTPTRYRLTEAMFEPTVPELARTGRLRLRRSPADEDPPALAWDDGEPWELWLEVRPESSAREYVVAGSLRRAGERRDLEEPVLLIAGGLVFWPDRVARFNDFGAFAWVSLLRQNGPLVVPVKQKERLIEELNRLPRVPKLELPEELRFEEVAVPPRPRLRVRPPERVGSWVPDRLRGELSFEYDGTVVTERQAGRGVYQADRHRLLLRDRDAEAVAAARLAELGFRPAGSNGDLGLELAPRNLPRVVQTLLAEGWHVEAEGKVYRPPGEFKMEVRSGIDWFELDGGVSFGDQTVPLPELLAALERGADSVKLGDGSYGMLPEEWLKKYAPLAGLGTKAGDKLKFKPTQVGLLDALLTSQPAITFDETFGKLRDELHGFEGVQPADPPKGFVGQLRPYQREGLGWLRFLERYGFGGCLADDMGLGKTVQVLALLEARRAAKAGPSLVVVPRSLVFNWIEEAGRFAPALRVLDHTGPGRGKPGPHFDEHDLILTTYGTLRRDAPHFKDFGFDYCILDEAQAVKNASSESAKAVRLLRGKHRLALSGTPIENHLGELWSIFEFLNPGMLGTVSVFQGGLGGRSPAPESREVLARALRPFILRRTKEQVAKDLPEKLEQTLHCELEPPQRKLYNELRAHYRQSLLAKVDKDGLNRSKVQVLEALLRLRQAACHPGLIDPDKAGEPSAKLEALLPLLAEVLDEGHKALVFSQFTKFLAIVRDRLDAEGVVYEYLDGRTRNRAARVERFQTDPDCKLFLISLKAGGVGLNLTAADYVFLLDPWWNPAVEAQAVDRAHRIGQSKKVFAYRLIAHDTVEEKVLELQQNKRDLADAIINADNSLIRNLGRDDLELLLS